MRIRTHHILAPASAALLLSIAAICTQAAPAWAEDAKPAKVKKPPSVCVGLGVSACGGKPECYWRQATTTKAGKTRRAHCRIKRSASKNAAT